MAAKFLKIIYFSLISVIFSFTAKAQSYLDINNVKALINYEGSFFLNHATQSASFEIPKGQNKCTIFASTLWIGGFDSGNNLHEAAQTYRQKGTDYWAGPLDTIKLSSDTSGWQRTWKINRSLINDHRKNYKNSGYVVPQELLDWPANGTGTHAKVLAPFVDMDSNMVYDPSKGDFPFILGDQSVYFIMNDSFSKHGETAALPLGLEIHAMAYAFNSPVDGYSLDNTVFIRYEIKNRSKLDYHNVYAGIWTDFDIGFAFDDYIGCDSNRNMYFGYNGDTLDEGVKGYGTNPPVEAIKFLNRKMSHFMYYTNDFSERGNPDQAIHYYNYLSGKFKNGQTMRYGGDGFNIVWDSSRFENNMFPADPRLPKPAWSEASAGNFKGDRRGLGSIGPINLKAGEYFVLDIAYIYNRGTYSNYLNVFDDLNTNADKIQQIYNKGKITNPVITGLQDEEQIVTIQISPNPMVEYTNISFCNPRMETFNLQITDLFGRLISTQTTKTDKIKILRNDLKPGIYIVTLSNNISKGQIKLVVK